MIEKIEKSLVELEKNCRENCALSSCEKCPFAPLKKVLKEELERKKSNV